MLCLSIACTQRIIEVTKAYKLFTSQGHIILCTHLKACTLSDYVLTPYINVHINLHKTILGKS